MQMLLGVMISAAFAEEGHEHLTEHIKRGHSCSSEAEQPQERMSSREGLPQNLIFGEKPRQRRNTGNSESRDEKRHEGVRQLLPEPAHFAHVLLPAHGVDDTARAKKQTCLEERMGHKVENRCCISASSYTQDHIPELADRRTSQDALDVV